MMRHYRNKHGTTHPYPQSTHVYPLLPPPPTRGESTTTAASDAPSGGKYTTTVAPATHYPVCRSYHWS